ncbi:MAG: hypothetical protein LBK61_10530 [Spirochaetaceae bacterium]|nr:hypothetical protein [Spirochaetaceae bacterium]
MEDYAKVADKEHLSEKVDELTAENRRCFLGVLEALSFAQSIQSQGDTGAVEEKG